MDTFFSTLCYLLFAIILLKLIIQLIRVLLNFFGRNCGLGVEWTVDNGEYAVIVGATGVVGNAYAHQFASLQYNLVLISRSDEKLKQLAERLKSRYKVKSIKVLVADFTKPETFDTIRAQLATIEPIFVLVNCTSMSLVGKNFHEIADSLSQDLIALNVITPVKMMQMVLPRMVEQQQGVIINFSSQLGEFRLPYFAIYCASRAFLTSLTEIVSFEYLSQGVIIQNVKPLFIESNSNILKPNCLMVRPSASVLSSVQMVGIDSSAYGHWKHILAAFLLNFLQFTLGYRLASRVLQSMYGSFLNHDPYDDEDEEDEEEEDPNNSAGSSSESVSASQSKLSQTGSQSNLSKESTKESAQPEVSTQSNESTQHLAFILPVSKDSKDPTQDSKDSKESSQSNESGKVSQPKQCTKHRKPQEATQSTDQAQCSAQESQETSQLKLKTDSVQSSKSSAHRPSRKGKQKKRKKPAQESSKSIQGKESKQGKQKRKCSVQASQSNPRKAEKLASSEACSKHTKFTLPRESTEATKSSEPGAEASAGNQSENNWAKVNPMDHIILIEKQHKNFSR